MTLANAQPGSHCLGSDKAAGVTHYLIGNIPESWRRGVSRFKRVRCESVLPSIDLEYHTRNGFLEYDFIVRPGADPHDIVLEFDSSVPIQIDSSGRLTFGQGASAIRQQAPFSYQKAGSERVAVPSWFRQLSQNRVGFEVAEYDPSSTLIIDPVLFSSTQLGGAGGEVGRSIVVDAEGNTYVGGTTQSFIFPIVGGSSGGAKLDKGFVAKFDPSGELVFSTLFGGAEKDHLLGLALDSGGEIVLTGWTSSPDFPVKSAFQAGLAGESDAFLAKLTADGTGLVFSTYLGGSGREDLDKSIFSEDPYGGVAVDSSGNIFLTGVTASTDFPVENAFQSAGNQTDPPSLDAFVSSFDEQGALRFSSYLGGSGREIPRSIVVSPGGEILVGGGTDSVDFPLVSPIRDQFSSEASSTSPLILTGEGFLSRLAASGQSLIFSSYIGGSGGEVVGDVDIDGSGSIWLFGHTDSPDFAAGHGVQGQNMKGAPVGLQAALKGQTDFFLLSLDAALEVQVVGYFGGSSREQAGRLALDAVGGLHFTGSTRSADYPLVNPLQGRLSGSTDVVVTSIQGGGLGAVEQSTLLGAAGFGNEIGTDIVSSGTSILVTGISAGGGRGLKAFPLANQYSRGTPGGFDAFITRIDSAPGPFLGPFPDQPWSRFVRMDTNGNGIPDPADEILSLRRDGEKLEFASSRWSARPLFFSDPDPETGRFRVVTRKNSSRISPSFINLETTATVLEQHFGGISRISVVQENRRRDTVKSGEVELLDTDDDGLVDTVAGQGDGIPRVRVSLQLVDVNNDAVPDFVTIPWSMAQIVGVNTGDSTFDPQVFVPLGDTDQDGVPDRPAFDLDADQLPDPDLPLLAAFSGPSSEAKYAIYFAQFGEGSGQLSSRILLFSLTEFAATAHLQVRDDGGQPLSVDINGETIAETLTVQVPACGILELKTDGLGPLAAGSVRVTSDQPLAGVILFDGVVGLAGVGASPEIAAGFAAPMEEDEADQIHTGIAFMNLEAEPLQVLLSLLDSSGLELATAALDLAANGHRALFLAQLFPGLELAAFAGTLIAHAPGRIAATVLQTRPGEFATLPVTPLGQGANSLVFSHFGEGLGILFSQIQVLNMENRETNFQVILRDDQGSRLTTDFNGEIVEGQATFPLPASGIGILKTDGLGEIVTGSVNLFTPASHRLAGVLLFGGSVGVAGVGESSELVNGFMAPIQSNHEASLQTGLALANMRSVGVSVRIRLFNAEGTLLARSELELPRLGHRALFADQLDWATEPGQTLDFAQFLGLLKATSDQPIFATVLQSRPGQFATMPVSEPAGRPGADPDPQN